MWCDSVPFRSLGYRLKFLNEAPPDSSVKPPWSWGLGRAKPKDQGEARPCELLRQHPSDWTSEKSPTYELTLSSGFLSTGGVLLCSCGTVAHRKSLGRATLGPHVGVRTIRGAYGLILCAFGQSRDFLGLGPSPNSEQFFLRATPPLVRRLCHQSLAYAGLGTFQSMITW